MEWAAIDADGAYCFCEQRFFNNECDTQSNLFVSFVCGYIIRSFVSVETMLRFSAPVDILCALYFIMVFFARSTFVVYARASWCKFPMSGEFCGAQLSNKYLARISFMYREMNRGANILFEIIGIEILFI